MCVCWYLVTARLEVGQLGAEAAVQAVVLQVANRAQQRLVRRAGGKTADNTLNLLQIRDRKTTCARVNS